MRIMIVQRKGACVLRVGSLAMSPFSLLLFLALASGSYAQDGSDAPVFEPLFSSGEVTFTVRERATEGTEVGLVRAQGLPQETVLYGVEDLGDEWEGAFEIGSSSGEIAVGPNGANILVINGALLSIRFGVFAYYESAGLNGNRSILSVTVQIEDVNDSPYFEDIETQIFVESVAVGDVLRRITATDNDLGVNAALEYSLHQISRPSGGTEDSFSIHRYTGDLTVIMSLSVGFEYQLTITATDEGEPSLSASINVTIVDDPVPPVFDERVYEVELLEFTNKNRVPVVNVSATAPDEDEVVYSIIKWSPAPEGLNFTVGSSTGYVYATGTLDRETFSRYTITVEAYAYVGAPSEATVVLHVGDVNEPPQFSRSHYSAAVSEGAELGYLFYSSVMATDRDEGLSNSEVTYSIGSILGLTTADGTEHNITDDIFTINPSTAELFVNSDLEREAQEENYHYYEITVIATDGGIPPLSSSSVVAVTVTDVNDNAPEFSASLYSYEVSESVDEGTPIGTVQVSDRDEGRAANISFSLTGSGSNLFRISVVGVSHPQTVQARPPTVTTGRIYTIGQLDREQVSRYDLTVVARDTSDQPLSGSSQVTITVLDYNDNAPEFSKDTFTFEVEEESLLGDGLVGSLTAVDDDEGSNALFDFSLAVGARESEIFSLEASGSTVELRLLRALDRETDDSYSLRLQATDRGSPSLVGETIINITVLDVNDETPVFSEGRYEVNITEGSPIGTPLLGVSATDGDVGENAVLTYSVVGGVVSVSRESGEVELGMVLDYEEASTVEIQVLATDSGNPALVGSATIVITVLDINDNTPLFENSVYSVMVYENVTIGTELIRVVANDADSGERGSVRFTLSGSEGELFAVGETSGAVTLGDPGLDRELVEGYQLLLTATDMGSPPLSSSARLLITVVDVNDNSPVFQQSLYRVQVSEGVVVNSSLGAEVVTVVATDDDAGSNGEISYLLSGSGAGMFSINSTGLVTVAQPLDYEIFPGPYVLTVIARDNGEASRSAAATLEVSVTDANDNAPTFLGIPYVIRLEEGTTGPLVVLVATATDPDDAESGEVEFALIGGGDLFVGDRLGSVNLVEGGEVDREGGEVREVGEGGEGVITLILSAVDNGSPIQLTQTSVRVLISDVNDNQPVFQQSSYFTSVSEAQSVGSDILNLLATDSDNGINASVIYTIEDQLPQLTEPVFVIDNQTGVIYLSSPLDREIHDSFSLFVSARDQGTPSLSSSVVVTVNVSDANDNHPVFTIPPGGYASSLSEDSPLGSEVITVVATDRDLALNSHITYSLREPALPFQIQNPEVGRITLSSPLDRETSSQYSLIVVASDTAADTNSSLQTEAVVTVIVLDVNDNAPEFIASSFEGRVSENRPANTTVSLFPELLATDADTASNGVITYTLTGADAHYFMLDPQTAQLTTALVLDAEVSHTYHDLQVVATDNGGLSSTVPLQVIVEDVNDFTPFFTIEPNTTVTVSEALAPEEVVFVVTATDSDARENILNFSLGPYQQNRVDGELTSGNPFVIDSATGAISVGGQGLDFELSSYYILTVTVEDSGSPPQSNSTQLVVLLTDVNDNSPTFNPHSQSFNILENSPTGSRVGRVAVSDADSEDLTQLQYLIVSGNDRGLFVINTTTGDIATTADIDREEGETHTLIIEARDDVTLFRSGTGTAVVTVDDVNDQIPSFPPLSVVEIEEEQPAGTPVAEFAATDEDAGVNGSLSYEIVSSVPAAHFTIDSVTGEISTATQLDRETYTTYFLIIQASDRGIPILTGTANLTIRVTDINDNSPEFNGTFEATIIENPLQGSLLRSNYSAYDRDEGSNAELTWEIFSGNIFEAFRVDPTTGALLVQNTSELDYEVTPVFFLELLVTDSGDPPRSSSLLVRVSLVDANDHAPVVSPLPPLTLPEDTPTDSIVAVVTATDEDTGSNAELQFLIVTGNTGGVFTMRADGGLRVSAPLDFETVTHYDLVIEARDRGTPVLIDSITVVVDVTDVNDNAPEFTALHLSGNIPEDRMNPQIAAPTISDPDSGSNGEYDLRVLSANGGSPSPFFAIFNLIAADGTLDYEEETQYTLVLEVSDRGVPSLTTTAQITVNIEDVDDNPPIFPEPPHYTIREDQSILTPFAVLQTEDRDTPENSDVFYYITGGESTEYFDVFSQTGQLYLNQPVDRETVAVHVLEITAQSFRGDASDCTELSCSVTTLTVSLTDVNDNTPQWSLREYIIGVNETTVPGTTTIGRIEAHDADAEDFGLVWYRLMVPATPLVTLEEETGVLRLNQSLDSLQFRVSPVFTAVAFDNRGLSPSSISMNVPVMIVSVAEEYLVVLTISQSLAEVQADTNQLQRVVEMVPGARLSVYDIRESSATEEEAGGGVVKRQSPQTDVVLFGLSSDRGQLLTSQQTLDVISDNASVFGDMYTITTVKVFPVPASEDDSGDLDRLTLTIVVASVVVGVLLVFLFVTFCGCCWLQNRLKQKRKYYEPSRRSNRQGYRDERESVRYSTAEGVELYGDSELFRDSWGGRGWGEEEEDTFRPKEVTMREGGRRNRDRGATDSGTRPWDSRDSEEVRSVLYESKDFVMDVFEDSDVEDEGMEAGPTAEGGEETGSLGYSLEGEREEEDDMVPTLRPQSHLEDIQEAEEAEEEEEEEGEWEDGTTGAEVWEEGEGGEEEGWGEEPSPADMMTEEEARMLAAPLEDEGLPPDPLLF